MGRGMGRRRGSWKWRRAAEDAIYLPGLPLLPSTPLPTCVAAPIPAVLTRKAPEEQQTDPTTGLIISPCLTSAYYRVEAQLIVSFNPPNLQRSGDQIHLNIRQPQETKSRWLH